MPAPRPKKPRSDGLEARARVLDSAEALFAERGFHGTSIRDITEHAGVRLAAVNYHFVSKEILFRDVLQRRAAVLAEERLAQLACVPARGSKRARSEALVAAFVSPLVPYAQHSAGFRNYLALIAQTSSSRLHALLLVESTYNPLAQRFIAALAEIFPGAKSAPLHHAYTFMLASTMYSFSNNLRLDSMTHGKLRSDDFAAISGNLVTFVAGGLVALCDAQPRPRRRA
jgi:AcrR family transcriptional regulator